MKNFFILWSRNFLSGPYEKPLAFLIILLSLTGCVAKKEAAIPQKNMIGGGKILMVIAPKDFRDAEYNEPRKVFEENGFEVKVASIQGGEAIGAEGTVAQIDLLTTEVSSEDFNAVVFVGGPGMSEIMGDDTLRLLAKNFYGNGKITAAICVASGILADAEILNGKKATSWSGIKERLIENGANFVDSPVVTDGRIITANGPESARQFGEEIVKELNKQ